MEPWHHPWYISSAMSNHNTMTIIYHYSMITKGRGMQCRCHELSAHLSSIISHRFQSEPILNSTLLCQMNTLKLRCTSCYARASWCLIPWLCMVMTYMYEYADFKNANTGLWINGLIDDLKETCKHFVMWIQYIVFVTNIFMFNYANIPFFKI